VHYGDSLITGDFVTGTMRRLLQERFGDGGPGFHLASKAWDWYAHDGVTVSGPDGKVSRITSPTIKDGLYGLGGVTAVFPPGTTLTYKVGKPKSGPVRADLYYLSQPGGGTIQVLGDGEAVTSVQTGAAGVRSGFLPVALPSGATKLTLKTLGGPVRLFGLAFETAGPGVQYDSIGINGGRIGLLMRIEQAHWAEQLARRKPDLVVFEFGTNESMNENLKEARYAVRYEKELRAVLARFRKALPDASCLVMAPMDRGAIGSGGVSTAATVPVLVLSQRKVALTEGCAFFNTFKAMGGTDSFARWMAAKPKLASGDYSHPTAPGAELVGRMLFKALDKAAR
jgi:lysophospholipase L1-like esterase